MYKVLIIATSHKTRGGITSVINAHKKGPQWQKYHCKWIETHIDKGSGWKILYFIKGWFTFICLLPFCKLVHIHMSEPPSAIRKCMFMPFAKLLGKKVIIHFHAFSPNTTINSKYKNIYKYLFKQANCVIVLSQLWEKYVNSAFNLGDKVRIVYNPCTSEVSDKTYQKKKQILYAGTINSRKGYADMIKAFAKIANKYPNWRLIFAGNGEIKQGEKLSSSLGIEKQTIFLGWVNGEQKDKVFKESEIFCLPSYAEGFPMAVLDAWAYGLPVITTPVGGIPDIAEDGKNLLLFTPGDVEQLAKQFERMIRDENLRNKIANESIRLAHTTFNQQVINKQIGDIYKELLNN
jgi:glycosyltransferase involved in cell wall biosynthesis